MGNKKTLEMKINNRLRNIYNKALNTEKTKHQEKIKKSNTDFSKFETSIIDKVSDLTMTSPERIVTLVRAIQYIEKNNLAGDVVECGVWKGGSVGACLLTLISSNNLKRNIWLYDTYEGMNEPSDYDIDINGKSASERMALEYRETSWVWAKAQLELVRKNVYKFGYPIEKIKFIKGLVEETLNSNEIPEKISLLRLDTDWYESTKIELEILFPRLVSGGALIIDDYGHWNGCRKAVDEYFDSLKFSPFSNRIDYTGRLIIKP